MQQLYPTSRKNLEPDQVYTVPELNFPPDGRAAGPGRRPYVYFNMVSSVDGKASGPQGDAAGLGSPTDHYLMGRLRVAADAVLAGAETFRRDPFVPAVRPDLAGERARYFPDAPQPWGVVLSSDGNLPLNKKFFRTGRPVVALGERADPTRAAELSRYARIVPVPDGPDGRPDLKWLLDYFFNEMGVRRLLCEGGPRLNYSLISAGLGDELFWTLAPKLAGDGPRPTTILSGPAAGFRGGRMPGLELVSLYEHDHELFFRYRLKPEQKSE